MEPHIGKILEAAIRTWEKIVKSEDKGIRPINRPDAFNREKRAMAKLTKRPPSTGGGIRRQQSPYPPHQTPSSSRTSRRSCRERAGGRTGE
jgi:hypothetical protein